VRVDQSADLKASYTSNIPAINGMSLSTPVAAGKGGTTSTNMFLSNPNTPNPSSSLNTPNLVANLSVNTCKKHGLGDCVLCNLFNKSSLVPTASVATSTLPTTTYSNYPTSASKSSNIPGPGNVPQPSNPSQVPSSNLGSNPYGSYYMSNQQYSSSSQYNATSQPSTIGYQATGYPSYNNNYSSGNNYGSYAGANAQGSSYAQYAANTISGPGSSYTATGPSSSNPSVPNFMMNQQPYNASHGGSANVAPQSYSTPHTNVNANSTGFQGSFSEAQAAVSSANTAQNAAPSFKPYTSYEEGKSLFLKQLGYQLISHSFLCYN
jgi:hypothetical protein